ncbi:MAG: hypothetical protein PHP48_06790 [Bacteroidales bacterium]|jgi:hypothetical protein|nr:hypothetical protein [Bacteroidales bacterium]
MKNLFFLAIILTSFVFTSCQKEDANKDVETAINQLKIFNQTFSKFYQDGVISKDTLANNDNSEYDMLKKLASNYYETINRINKNVQKGAEKLKKGNKSEHYEDQYKSAISNQSEEIELLTSNFINNLQRIEKIE